MVSFQKRAFDGEISQVSEGTVLRGLLSLQPSVLEKGAKGFSE